MSGVTVSARKGRRRHCRQLCCLAPRPPLHTSPPCSRLHAAGAAHKIKGGRWTVFRFFLVSLAFTSAWVAVSSQLAYYRRIHGPAVLLQLNIAYFLPSIPLLIGSAFLDKPLETRLGENEGPAWNGVGSTCMHTACQLGGQLWCPACGPADQSATFAPLHLMPTPRSQAWPRPSSCAS